jgi:branched-chain amino acid transport system ATP-binding protein
MGILEVQNVNKSFGGLKALQNVNLNVDESTIHAIIGPNGAGKSTLLNCFVGRLIPEKPHEINQIGVSRVFQTPEIFSDLTVFENVMIPCFAKRDGAFSLEAIKPVSNEVDICEKAEQMLLDVDMADKKDMTASSLSRGDKRRLEMAMCLSQDPKLLLLDEPTAGMARADTNNTIELLAKIQAKRQITMVVIEHDMHVVFSLAQKISVLAQGTVIVEDLPENIKGHPKVQEAYLGTAHN